MMQRCLILFALGLVIGGCEPKTAPPAPAPSPPSAQTGTRVFRVKGLIREIADDRKSAVIRHEEIPGYMPKMTMQLTVKNPDELTGLAAGDEIRFELHADAETHWIEKIIQTGRQTKETVAVKPAAKYQDAALKVGDTLPHFTLLTESGQTVKFSDYRGQAVAFTFIFTRCPLPDFCPRMSRQFAKARALLRSENTTVTNWQFISLSFDPEFDRPSVLANYARNYRAGDADRWIFTAASEDVLRQLAPLCDLTLNRENVTISHNLRTVVLDTEGRIFKQLDGNSWDDKQLAAAIIEAARTKKP
jgi:protein SCO1/2